MTWQREPGLGSYARAERERRFLVRCDPPVLHDSRTVEDRYLDGTRLRLRHVSAGGRSVWKLTQKVRVDETDPASGRIGLVWFDQGGRVRAACPGGRCPHRRGDARG